MTGRALAQSDCCFGAGGSVVSEHAKEFLLGHASVARRLAWHPGVSGGGQARLGLPVLVKLGLVPFVGVPVGDPGARPGHILLRFRHQR